MGRFSLTLLLEDDTSSTRYNILKIDRNSNLSTDCTLVTLSFTVESYGIKFIYDEMDTPHGNVCFSNITITHSVF